MPERAEEGPISIAENKSLAEQMGESTSRHEFAGDDPDTPYADRMINAVAEALGVACLGGITVLTFYNAVGRYLFNAPATWTEEVVFSLVPWVAMIGLFLSVRRRQMITMNFYVHLLPSFVRRFMEAVGQIFCAAIFGYVAWLGLEYMMMFGSDATPHLGYPRWVFTSSLFVGCLGVAIAFLVEAWRKQRLRARH